MSPHPFFRGFLSYYGAQLHHIPPNAMVYLAAFALLCENLLGCPPHWALSKHIFSCRPQNVKKPLSSTTKTKLVQLCGG